MSDGFNWQTEAEESWQSLEQKTAVSPASTRPSHLKQWRSWCLICITILTLFLLMRQQLNRRVADTMATVERDLMSSHTIMQQTRHTTDADLFRTILSGKDDQWTETTVTLLQKTLLFNPTPFGLHYQSTNVHTPTMTIDPDLRQAILTFPQTYALSGIDSTNTITLTQTAVYRLGHQRWLLAPPETNFWGEHLSTTGTYVTVHYPQRDVDLSERLAHDIDDALARMCDALTCQPQQHLNLFLSHAPDAMLILSNTTNLPLQSTESLTLPTISLVGTPIDDESYNALLLGYFGYVAPGFIVNAVGEPPPLPWVSTALTQIGSPDITTILNTVTHIRARHDAWFTAVAEQDLSPFLDPETPIFKSPFWIQQLAEQHHEQDIYDRTALGLTRLNTPPRWHHIRLNRDLTGAHVFTAIDYTPITTKETITLYQSTYYSYNNALNIWQLDAPYRWLDEKRHIFTGERLTLRYYPTERNISLQLANRLDHLLEVFCADLDDQCQHPLAAQFDIAITRPLPAISHEYYGDPLNGTLPTPSQLGLPATEAGFEALYRGYAALLLAQIVSNLNYLTEPHYQQHRTLYRQALIDMELISWQPTQQSVVDAAPPDLNIQLLCYAPNVEATILSRYNLQTGIWQETVQSRYIDFPVWITTDDETMIVRERRQQNDTVATRYLTWPHGDWEAEQLLVDWYEGDSHLLASYAPLYDPHQLRLVQYDKVGNKAYYDVNTDACDKERGCQLTPREQVLQWSPNGRFALIGAWDQNHIPRYYIGDQSGEKQNPIETDGTPIWVDDSTIAYVDRAGEHVHTLNLETNEAAFTITLDDITEILSGSHYIIEHRISTIRHFPNNDNQLMLSLWRYLEPEGVEITILIYDISQARLTLFTSLRNSSPPPLPFSPDGRWLTLFEWAYQGLEPITIDLIDLNTRAKQTYHLDSSTLSSLLWTSDGAWLMVADNGRIQLIHPETQQQYTITPPHHTCLTAQWVQTPPTQ